MVKRTWRSRPDAGGRRTEDGYAMVTLLVAIALMSVFMSAALPAWRHAAQREKEAELLWRGRQYDRALQLYRQKYGTPGPPNVDLLVKEKFLRKKYKDPITRGDFDLRPVSPMGAIEIEGGPQSGRGQQSGPFARRRGDQESADGRSGRESGELARGQLLGGVRSRSKAKSIMVLNGKQHYNEWDFSYVPYQSRAAQGPEQASPTRPGRQPRAGAGRSNTSPRSRQSTPRGSPRGR